MPKKKQQKQQKKMPTSRNWVVTTSADRPIKEIARDLEDAGFSVGQVNDEIQSITGAAGDESVKKLRKISGVVDVSPDTAIDIGPPDSPKTW
jgi:predicted CoA-binding protein